MFSAMLETDFQVDEMMKENSFVLVMYIGGRGRESL
jgi:hypothetical protein